MKSANLHISNFTLTKFRIWIYFNLLNVTPLEVENLKKLEPAPAIPIDQLRAQIANFRTVSPNKNKPQIYYVGGGSGSVFILLIVICCLLYWRCKNPETRSQTSVTYTALENPNMMHTRVGAISAHQYSALGQETVGIQDPEGTLTKVLNGDMQYAFASALLDQLEDLGADVNEHCRRLRTRQYSAMPHIEVKPSPEI